LAAFNGGTWQDLSDPRQPHEAAVLKLNIDKSLSRLAWRPVWDAAEAIRRTAHWYRRFFEARDGCMLAACHADIDCYENASRSP